MLWGPRSTSALANEHQVQEPEVCLAPASEWSQSWLVVSVGAFAFAVKGGAALNSFESGMKTTWPMSGRPGVSSMANLDNVWISQRRLQLLWAIRMRAMTEAVAKLLCLS